jgi:hypothetical protein
MNISIQLLFIIFKEDNEEGRSAAGPHIKV